MSHCLMTTLRIRRSENLALLRAGKIDQIVCPLERDHSLGRRWLITDILTETPCPYEAIPHLRRLFPEMKPEEWSRLLTDYDVLTQEVLEAFLSEDMLDLNHNTLLFYALSPTRTVHPSQKRDMAETLLDAGVDVNECMGEYRTPFLIEYLEEVLYEIEGEDVEESVRILLPWLLERGADPLLEDRMGMNTLDHVRGFRDMPERQKNWILAELERWV